MDEMSRALILMYHAIDTPRSASEARYCVTPTAFREQIAYLPRAGLNPIPLSQLVDAFRSEKPIPQNSVVVTFDDGFECFQRNALPVLTEYRIPATLFAVAGKLGETNSWMQAKGWPERRLMDAGELRAVQAAGMAIGCHALSHIPLTKSSDSELKKETADARRLLSEAVGADVTQFAYPHGAQGKRERRAVAEAGFVAACSTEPGFNGPHADLFALRRIDIYGSDTLASFRRKLQFGANRVTRGDLARYYLNRIAARFHG
jgi:peptidoglycan/xylan/chitin deacetylase (PgdA/CDA1 family)